MIGTVQKRFVSKAGNPMLTIDGQHYVCKDVDVSKLQLGDKLEFEAHSFGDGKMWSMDKFKLVEAALKYPPPHQQGMVNTAPIASNGSMTGVLDAERPCVSNWGAELIKAGLIKNPGDLQAWIEAIKSALR